jgi:hypothetical protein
VGGYLYNRRQIMGVKKYAVLVREVWIQVYHIEANSQEEAIQKVAMGEGTIADGVIEYSHQLSSGSWTAEEKP